MAVTKAQLVVWGLIAALSAGGYTALSQVKLPGAALPDAVDQWEATTAPLRVVLPTVTATADTASTAAEEPAPAVSVFPFPDEIETATASASPEPVAPQPMPGFAELPVEVAAPDIESIDTLGDTAPEIAPAVMEAVVDDAPPLPATRANPASSVPSNDSSTLYVVADAVNVRAMPSTAGPILQRVPQGFAVTPELMAEDWVGFRLQDGSTGWIRTEYLSTTRSEPRSATATTEPLNLMM